MKRITVRIPEDLHLWLVRKAGSEMTKQERQISVNSLITAILERAREIDEARGLSIEIE